MSGMDEITPAETDTGGADEPQAEVIATWNASEFAFIKTKPAWFLIVIVLAVVAVGVLIFLRQWLTIPLVVVIAAALVVYARKEPRVLNYTLTNRGLHINDRLYPYDSFRSFWLANDYHQTVFELEPTARLMPMLSLPSSDENHELIEQTLEEHLPRSTPKNDWVDKLFRYFNF